MTEMRIPKYRRHSLRDIGFAEHAGKRIYFPGRHNSAESRAAYKTWLARHVGAAPALKREEQLSIYELVVNYLEHAERHYGSGARGEFANSRHALQHVVNLHRHEPAIEFGPLKLKQFQLALAGQKLSRTYINQTCAKLKRMFKWAASEELLPASVFQSLDTVPGLRAGKTAAKESPPKTPVHWEHVFATLTELSPTVTAMVLLQWHTGARSQSVCLATADQFNRSVDPWEWRPRHKTEYLQKEVVLFIGPHCQSLLTPLLEAAGDGALFRPQAQRPNQRYNKFYRSSAYYRAVTRAIERVNEYRQKNDLPLVPLWSPHQIRHAKGTLVRERFGVEGAQSVLGHSSLEATQIYAQRQKELARNIARETG